MEIPLAEREEFLNRKCGNNLELRREVESLIAFEEKAEDFIESPPEDLAEDFFTHRTDQNIIGKTLNNYHVLSLLGAGGMGEVYLAEDKKLGRKIAIKLLPKKFSENDERKGRFLREARSVSALNHPNIITVFGIEESDEVEFIVTEFIDGKTLYEKLSERSFEWQEVVEIAIQLTDALESAHKISIIHRDIKPANIMIRQDGYVKILDFGLAKMLSETPDAKVFNTTEMSKNRRVMGTMNYMSPEQTLGKELDVRTDIFSLGIVLYEMISGVQPFIGTSDAAVYNAILNSDPPPISKINEDIPPALEQIIKRAIEKDRDKRYQSILEMKNDLQILKENLTSGLSNESLRDYSFSNSTSSRRTKIFAPIAAIAAILISILGIYLYSNYISKNEIVEVGKMQYKQLTSQTGEETFPSLSPDGKTLIYSSNESRNWDIYFRRVDGSKAINLTKNSESDDKQAVYSPDGERIAFRSERDGGGIFIMEAMGESVRRVTDSGYFPSWSPDGKELVYSSSDFLDPTQRYVIPISLSIVNIASGEKRGLTEGDAVQPSWSPKGDRIAFWGLNDGGIRDIKTISVKSGEIVSVTDDSYLDWNPIWSPDGKYIYFSSNRGGTMNLWRVAIDENTGKALGAPESITTPSSYSQHMAFSKDGKKMAFVQHINSINIVKYDFDPVSETVGEYPTEITSGAITNRSPDISPDGEWLAIVSIRNKQEDLFIMRKDGSEIKQITNDKYNDRAPYWSPDGKQLAFFSDRSGKYEGWTINADGSNLQQVTDAKDTEVLVSMWSPDGKKILYNLDHDFPSFIQTDKLFAEQTPQMMPRNLPSDKWIMSMSWSPDGNRIASTIYGDDPKVEGVSIYNFDTNKHQILTDYGETPIWLSDSKRLIFFDTDKIFLADTSTNKIKEILSVTPNSLQIIKMSPDDRSIYASMNKNEADIWLVEFE